MVSVVKQQDETVLLSAVLTNPFDQFRLVPFVNDHEIGFTQREVEIEMVQFVTNAVELRIGLFKLDDRRPTVLRNQALQAPGIAWLINVHLMTTGQQLRRDAAEKVCVSMVPIGDQ